MTATAEDVIAAKIVCQLKLASPDVVRNALRALDKAATGAGIDILADLFSRGAIDKAGRARAKKYSRLYQAVRRAAVESALLQKKKLVSQEALDRGIASLETAGYDRRLGEHIFARGDLTAAQDRDLAQESERALAAEDTRVLAHYREEQFQGVDRSITKDRGALLDTGQFTIRKLFRSKESQRLARMGQLTQERDDETRRKTTPYPAPDRGEIDRMRASATFAAAAAPPESPAELSQSTPPSFTAMPGESSTELSFTRFGPYLVLRKLSQGARGTIFLARRADLSKPVALEVVRGPAAASAADGFRRESLVSQRVKSEFLVSVVDAGELEGAAYIAHEHAAGESLRSVLAREGAHEEARALSTFRAVASALAALHGAGFVHGDLSPEHVVVGTRAGSMAHPKVTGLARSRAFGETSEPPSEPAYTPPETLARGPADHRSDLYALGVLLYEVLTGSAPFQGATPEDTARLGLRFDELFRA
ncbi:serine/threonine protein kinase [bacterium]|nr:serine/threonine protein kinase [bacterium]